MKSLVGKKALITGSSSGIGKAIAILFAQEGADVIITSNTSQEKGNAVLEEISKYGGNSYYYSADLQKEMSIKNLFEFVSEKYGALDILINNAGRTFNVAFKDVSEETLMRDIQTNLTSSILCTKYAIPLMTNENGWIVNTASIRGVDYSGRPGIIGYCAAKTGITSFTKTIAYELAPKIFVNAVAPGFVDTGYMDTMAEEIKESWLNNIPIHRFIEPEEIAKVYLLLSTSKIFTGSIVVPDGGYSLLGR